MNTCTHTCIGTHFCSSAFCLLPTMNVFRLTSVFFTSEEIKGEKMVLQQIAAAVYTENQYYILFQPNQGERASTMGHGFGITAVQLCRF